MPYLKLFFCDNAKTFSASSVVLKDLVESDIFQERFKSCPIAFKFSPVYSPWYGAVWERLIRTVIVY